MRANARGECRNVIPCLLRTAFFGCLPAARNQVRLDELIDVPVHDGIDIAGLRPGAMVLHQLIRLEHIGPDLAAPGDVLLFAHQLPEFFFLLFFPHFIQPRFQDFHGNVLVLELRPFVLALHYDIGGEMCDPDRGIGLVHVLPARA